MNLIRVALTLSILAACALVEIDAGVIKDLFQKITHSNNKTEDVVKESSPICGSGIFSTPNKDSVSPEIIFITNRPSRSQKVNQNSGRDYDDNQRSSNTGREKERINEVANEFRFHMENVTLEELERNGFNPDAPVTFLMHGFTSGYPLQAWMTAIVEAYTIDRETSNSNHQSGHHNNNNHQTGYHNNNNHQTGYSNNNQESEYHNNNQQSGYQNNNQQSGYHNSNHNTGQHNSNSHDDSYSGNQQSDPERRRSDRNKRQSNRIKHNLFIINWNYAARGILYPRAVANIPTVASYTTRFINEKLLNEANIDPRRIQLIGHSLGAHLAGFVGKNTQSKLGRIYGLDPAGPCFGSISGPLYPASKRLAPSDAEEVITIHTNSALLGIDKPIGKYSVFVEGGAVQPGCKGGDALKSLGTLTFEGGNFDTIACSHSRAPNLITYRHDQTDSRDDCQLVAYECKDWDSFVAGHCGTCRSSSSNSNYGRETSNGQVKSVECLRLGLDWQYPDQSGRPQRRPTNSNRPTSSNSGFSTSSSNSNYGRERDPIQTQPTRRPAYQEGYTGSVNEGYNNQREDQGYGSTGGYGNSSIYNSRSTSRRPSSSYDENNYGQQHDHSNSGRHSTRRPSSNYQDRDRRAADSENKEPEERRSSETVKPINMYLRTGDTQPYCAYHYQVILELNEPFRGKKPPISLVLQDSESDSDHSSGQRKQQNSLSNDDFGNKYSDKIYTHLMTSGKKLKRIDHATLLFREGLPNGFELLKSLHINYMSHIDPTVRQNLSSQLCLVSTETDRGERRGELKNNRFYFKPCNAKTSSSERPSYGEEDRYNQKVRSNTTQY